MKLEDHLSKNLKLLLLTIGNLLLRLAVAACYCMLLLFPVVNYFCRLLLLTVTDLCWCLLLLLSAIAAAAVACCSYLLPIISTMMDVKKAFTLTVIRGVARIF